MLRQMLYTQWKWGRMELGVYAVVGFLVPTIAMKAIMAVAGSTATTISISSLLSAASGVGGTLVALSILCALSFALGPWLVDDRQGFVLSLSLPLPWAAFVRLRFTSGAILLLIPTIAVWLGGTLAALVIPIPSTLHAYPTSIAMRFYTASLVVYAATFALQYVAGRRAVWYAAGFIIALATVELIGLGLGLNSLSAKLWNAAMTWPGPFEVLTARWMLIDV